MEQLAYSDFTVTWLCTTKKRVQMLLCLASNLLCNPTTPLFIVYFCDCALCEVNKSASSTQVVASATGSGQAGSSGRKRGRKFNSNLDSDQQLFAPEGETQTWKPNTGCHCLKCNATNHHNVTEHNRSSFTLSLLCYHVVTFHTNALAH